MGLRTGADTRDDPIGSPWSNAPWVVIVTAGLAAVLLLAVLGTELVVGKRWARSYGGPEERARLQIHNLATSAELYGLERRRSLVQLHDLTLPDPVSGRPYIARIPPDPWGRPYEYRVLSSWPSAFEIRSLGADGRPGTPDDIVERGADFHP